MQRPDAAERKYLVAGDGQRVSELRFVWAHLPGIETRRPRPSCRRPACPHRPGAQDFRLLPANHLSPRGLVNELRHTRVRHHAAVAPSPHRFQRPNAVPVDGIGQPERSDVPGKRPVPHQLFLRINDLCLSLNMLKARVCHHPSLFLGFLVEHETKWPNGCAAQLVPRPLPDWMYMSLNNRHFNTRSPGYTPKTTPNYPRDQSIYQ